MSKNASIEVGKAENDIWIACGSCDRITSHRVLTLVNWRDESPDGYIDVRSSYMTVMCQGCRTVSFCVESTHSEDVGYDNYTGDEFLVKRYELYPSRIAGRREMDFIHEVPTGIYKIYSETRTALCGGQPILAGIGIRAIVEAVCTDRKASGNNLEQKIDSLTKMKLVTEAGAEILHNLRFMGNAAAHEVTAHQIDELDIAFGVVEYVLSGVYIMPLHAAKLPKKEKLTIDIAKSES